MNQTFTSIEAGLEQPQLVSSLQLSRQRLETLPTSIGAFTNLAMLNLWLNNLTSLPDEIAHLHYLLTIDISNNNFLTFPNILFSESLKNLKNINARFLQLEVLPSDIQKIRKLESLDLTGNKLTSLPEEIGNLEHLSMLRLNQNQLQTLPKSLQHCKKLKVLHIHNNPIVSKEEIQSCVPETCVIVF